MGSSRFTSNGVFPLPYFGIRSKPLIQTLSNIRKMRLPFPLFMFVILHLCACSQNNSTIRDKTDEVIVPFYPSTGDVPFWPCGDHRSMRFSKWPARKNIDEKECPLIIWGRGGSDFVAKIPLDELKTGESWYSQYECPDEAWNKKVCGVGLSWGRREAVLRRDYIFPVSGG